MKSIQDIINNLSPVDADEDATRTTAQRRGNAKFGTKRTEEQKEKLRGRTWTLSKESRASISAGVKARMAVHGSNRKGCTVSEEQKQKISAALKGKKQGPRTEEQRARNAEAQRLSKSVKLTCPHCGKSASKAMFVRWHGDNCKARLQVGSQVTK